MGQSIAWRLLSFQKTVMSIPSLTPFKLPSTTVKLIVDELNVIKEVRVVFSLLQGGGVWHSDAQHVRED